MTDAKSKRRRLSFSLRTVMVFIALLAVAFGLITRHAQNRKSAPENGPR